jgi:hypothetical protein
VNIIASPFEKVETYPALAFHLPIIFYILSSTLFKDVYGPRIISVPTHPLQANKFLTSILLFTRSDFG